MIALYLFLAWVAFVALFLVGLHRLSVERDRQERIANRLPAPRIKEQP